VARDRAGTRDVEATSTLLSGVGARVRAARLGLGWSQKELAARAGVSVRYLVQVEQGTANLTLERVADLAGALSLSLASVVAGLGAISDPVDQVADAVRQRPQAEQRALALDVARGQRRKVALVGLRGAGKSTVGGRLARRLRCRFVEVDREVERRLGMSLAEVFAFHGVEGYRAASRAALEAVLSEPGDAVIETGGSLVADEASYGMLLDHAHVVWLQASPEEHLRRVREQGDLRPMRARSDPLGELRGLLDSRSAAYARAHQKLDTEALGEAGVTLAVARALGR